MLPREIAPFILLNTPLAKYHITKCCPKFTVRGPSSYWSPCPCQLHYYLFRVNTNLICTRWKSASTIFSPNVTHWRTMYKENWMLIFFKSNAFLLIVVFYFFLSENDTRTTRLGLLNKTGGVQYRFITILDAKIWLRPSSRRFKRLLFRNFVFSPQNRSDRLENGYHRLAASVTKRDSTKRAEKQKFHPDEKLTIIRTAGTWGSEKPRRYTG